MGWPRASRSRARAPTGRARCPPTGGLVYAINHLHWIDVPLVGSLSPRNDLLRREGRGARASRARRLPPPGTARSRSGAASPTATRCARCARPRATAASSGSSSKGTRQRHGPARAGAAGRGDGRAPGGRARHPGRGLRHAVLDARQLRAVLGRVRRAGARSRGCRRAAAATRRRPPRSSGASTCSWVAIAMSSALRLKDYLPLPCHIHFAPQIDSVFYLHPRNELLHTALIRIHCMNAVARSPSEMACMRNMQTLGTAVDETHC